MIAVQPIALQLRYLQTIAEIAGDRNTAIIVPLPMELFSFLKKP